MKELARLTYNAKEKGGTTWIKLVSTRHIH